MDVGETSPAVCGTELTIITMTWMTDNLHQQQNNQPINHKTTNQSTNDKNNQQRHVNTYPLCEVTNGDSNIDLVLF